MLLPQTVVGWLSNRIQKLSPAMEIRLILFGSSCFSPTNWCLWIFRCYIHVTKIRWYILRSIAKLKWIFFGFSIYFHTASSFVLRLNFFPSFSCLMHTFCMKCSLLKGAGHILFFYVPVHLTKIWKRTNTEHRNISQALSDPVSNLASLTAATSPCYLSSLLTGIMDKCKSMKFLSLRNLLIFHFTTTSTPPNNFRVTAACPQNWYKS